MFCPLVARTSKSQRGSLVSRTFASPKASVAGKLVAVDNARDAGILGHQGAVLDELGCPVRVTRLITRVDSWIDEHLDQRAHRSVPLP
jgi:hypothetical protein